MAFKRSWVRDPSSPDNQISQPPRGDYRVTLNVRDYNKKELIRFGIYLLDCK